MIRRCAVLFVMLSVAGAAAAQETYTIKLKNAGKGETVQVSKQGSEQTETKIIDATGNVVQEETKTKKEDAAYASTILDQPAAGKPPTRLQRKYAKPRITEDGGERTLPYEGKTVLIEKKEDKYHFRIEGGDELTGKDAEVLEKEFSRPEKGLDELLLPGKPVHINETWKIDAARIVKEFIEAEAMGEPTIELDAAKATVTGKLLRAYVKDGRQFGVMDFRFVLPLKSLKLAEVTAEFEAGSRLTIEQTMDVCIDGVEESGAMKGKMEMIGNLTIKANGVEVKIAMNVKGTSTETRKEMTKK